MTDPLDWSERARREALGQLATRLGGEVETFGQSVEGRPLEVLRVCRGSPQAKVLVTANVHGLEWISARVALGVLEAVATQQPGARALLERAELWVAPCLNPDGFARTERAEGQGTVAQLRCNANGVDLNRNFPLPAGARRSALPFTGSSTRGSVTYHGPHTRSEPEVDALARLCEREGFHAQVALHSFMGTVIPPRVTSAHDEARYAALARAFAAAQPHFKSFRLAARHLDAWSGELDDFLHHSLRCWSLTVETFPVLHSLRQHLRAPATFWRYNPRAPQRYVDNDVPGVLAVLAEALALPRPKPVG